MHFEGSVLVEVDGNIVTPHWRGQVPCPPKFDIRDIDADSPIEYVIGDWIEQYGRRWIDEFTGSANRVNCPDGTLTPGNVERQTPTTATPDTWYCKITGEPCPIQALVPTDNKEAFIRGCNVEEAAEELDRPPEQYKEGLFQAVRKGKFTGEHHMAGREPCWQCQQKQAVEDVHDPWALTALHLHLDEETIDRKKRFRRAGLESWVGHPICAECFLELPDLFPDVEFSKWGLDLEPYRAVPYRLNFD
ncbi:hypothetical protein [Halorubrum sp. C191]|uniref:hypothetical protein n=1 Tax=Halorubrum sp. C191 TaxID=1383842 RepID=UPI0011818B83|nr:hypothetical protein [Halorubrum sp. C191]